MLFFLSVQATIFCICVNNMSFSTKLMIYNFIIESPIVFEIRTLTAEIIARRRCEVLQSNACQLHIDGCSQIHRQGGVAGTGKLYKPIIYLLKKFEGWQRRSVREGALT